MALNNIVKIYLLKKGKGKQKKAAEAKKALENARAMLSYTGRFIVS